MDIQNSLSIVLDAVFCVMLILSMVIMSRRGLIRSLYKLISIIVTVVLVAVLTQPVTSILEESQLGAVIYRNVNEKIENQEAQLRESGASGIDADSIWNMPEYIKVSPQLQGVKDGVSSAATHTITNVLVKLITSIALFIIIRLLVSVLFLMLDGIFKMPVLRSLNVIGGMAVGILNTVVITYVICAVISLDVKSFDSIKYIISQTYVLKYLYNNNILMSLFL